MPCMDEVLWTRGPSCKGACVVKRGRSASVWVMRCNRFLNPNPRLLYELIPKFSLLVLICYLISLLAMILPLYRFLLGQNTTLFIVSAMSGCRRALAAGRRCRKREREGESSRRRCGQQQSKGGRAHKGGRKGDNGGMNCGDATGDLRPIWSNYVGN
jgi:hypothetical protein